MGDQQTAHAIRWLVIENMVTLVTTAALVLGLYWMGAGGWSIGGFLLLLFMNTRIDLKTKS